MERPVAAWQERCAVLSCSRIRSVRVRSGRNEQAPGRSKKNEGFQYSEAFDCYIIMILI